MRTVILLVALLAAGCARTPPTGLRTICAALPGDRYLCSGERLTDKPVIIKAGER